MTPVDEAYTTIAENIPSSSCLDLPSVIVSVAPLSPNTISRHTDRHEIQQDFQETTTVTNKQDKPCRAKSERTVNRELKSASSLFDVGNRRKDKICDKSKKGETVESQNKTSKCDQQSEKPLNSDKGLRDVRIKKASVISVKEQGPKSQIHSDKKNGDKLKRTVDVAKVGRSNTKLESPSDKYCKSNVKQTRNKSSEVQFKKDTPVPSSTTELNDQKSTELQNTTSLSCLETADTKSPLVKISKLEQNEPLVQKTLLENPTCKSKVLQSDDLLRNVVQTDSVERQSASGKKFKVVVAAKLSDPKTNKDESKDATSEFQKRSFEACQIKSSGSFKSTKSVTPRDIGISDTPKFVDNSSRKNTVSTLAVSNSCQQNENTPGKLQAKSSSNRIDTCNNLSKTEADTNENSSEETNMNKKDGTLNEPVDILIDSTRTSSECTFINASSSSSEFAGGTKKLTFSDLDPDQETLHKVKKKTGKSFVLSKITDKMGEAAATRQIPSSRLTATTSIKTFSPMTKSDCSNSELQAETFVSECENQKISSSGHIESVKSCQESKLTDFATSPENAETSAQLSSVSRASVIVSSTAGRSCKTTLVDHKLDTINSHSSADNTEVKEAFDSPETSVSLPATGNSGAGRGESEIMKSPDFSEDGCDASVSTDHVSPSNCKKPEETTSVIAAANSSNSDESVSKIICASSVENEVNETKKSNSVTATQITTLMTMPNTTVKSEKFESQPALQNALTNPVIFMTVTLPNLMSSEPPKITTCISNSTSTVRPDHVPICNKTGYPALSFVQPSSVMVVNRSISAKEPTSDIQAKTTVSDSYNVIAVSKQVLQDKPYFSETKLSQLFTTKQAVSEKAAVATVKENIRSLPEATRISMKKKDEAMSSKDSDSQKSSGESGKKTRKRPSSCKNLTKGQKSARKSENSNETKGQSATGHTGNVTVGHVIQLKETKAEKTSAKFSPIARGEPKFRSEAEIGKPSTCTSVDFGKVLVGGCQPGNVEDKSASKMITNSNHSDTLLKVRKEETEPLCSLNSNENKIQQSPVAFDIKPSEISTTNKCEKKSSDFKMNKNKQSVKRRDHFNKLRLHNGSSNGKTAHSWHWMRTHKTQHSENRTRSNDEGNCPPDENQKDAGGCQDEKPPCLLVKESLFEKLAASLTEDQVGSEQVPEEKKALSTVKEPIKKRARSRAQVTSVEIDPVSQSECSLGLVANTIKTVSETGQLSESIQRHLESHLSHAAAVERQQSISVRRGPGRPKGSPNKKTILLGLQGALSPKRAHRLKEQLASLQQTENISAVLAKLSKQRPHSATTSKSVGSLKYDGKKFKAKIPPKRKRGRPRIKPLPEERLLKSNVSQSDKGDSELKSLVKSIENSIESQFSDKDDFDVSRTANTMKNAKQNRSKAAVLHRRKQKHIFGKTLKLKKRRRRKQDGGSATESLHADSIASFHSDYSNMESEPAMTGVVDSTVSNSRTANSPSEENHLLPLNVKQHDGESSTRHAAFTYRNKGKYEKDVLKKLRKRACKVKSKHKNIVDPVFLDELDDLTKMVDKLKLSDQIGESLSQLSCSIPSVFEVIQYGGNKNSIPIFKRRVGRPRKAETFTKHFNILTRESLIPLKRVRKKKFETFGNYGMQSSRKTCPSEQKLPLKKRYKMLEPSCNSSGPVKKQTTALEFYKQSSNYYARKARKKLQVAAMKKSPIEMNQTRHWFKSAAYAHHTRIVQKYFWQQVRRRYQQYTNVDEAIDIVCGLSETQIKENKCQANQSNSESINDSIESTIHSVCSAGIETSKCDNVSEPLLAAIQPRKPGPGRPRKSDLDALSNRFHQYRLSAKLEQQRIMDAIMKQKERRERLRKKCSERERRKADSVALIQSSSTSQSPQDPLQETIEEVITASMAGVLPRLVSGAGRKRRNQSLYVKLF